MRNSTKRSLAVLSMITKGKLPIEDIHIVHEGALRGVVYCNGVWYELEFQDVSPDWAGIRYPRANENHLRDVMRRMALRRRQRRKKSALDPK